MIPSFTACYSQAPLRSSNRENPMRKLVTVLAFLALTAFAPVLHAEDVKPYSDNKEINLLLLLPPPAASDSAQMKAELGEVLTLQVTRTKEMEARAIADATQNVWRFADAIDSPTFNAAALPKVAAFFERIFRTKGAVNDPAKEAWKRLRPHLYSDLVKPVVPIETTGSYPSGHAILGTLMGIELANMLPEKRAAIMARAWEFAHNREVGGIHYPSDVETGRIAGTVIAQTISTHPDFRQEFEAAKAELRAALGL
jgi:acid phosphatase (class A)